MIDAGQSPVPAAHSAPGDQRPAPEWGPALVAVCGVILLIILLYWDTAVGMVTIWYRSETFTHAFVVPPITMWLVWGKRHELAAYVPDPSPVFLIGVFGFALLWLLGDMTAVNSVTQLALVAMLVLAVPTVLGFAVARVILFPLAFLFFAVPIGEFLMPWFMEMTADFAVAALRLSGIPVLREGLQFVIPSGNWSVVEACSGIRYLIASVTVGTLFAYLNYQSTLRRVLFVLVSIVVPVVANWLRAYMIVMLGHLSGNTIAVGVDHLIYGWVFFGVVIMLMFVVGARWSEPEPAHQSVGRRPVSGAVPASPAARWLVIATLSALVALPLTAKWMLERALSAGPAVLVAPSGLAAGWRVANVPIAGFKPRFENPSAETTATYERAGAMVGVYLGYYRNQDYNRKLVSSSNVLLTSDNRDWSQVASGRQTAKFAATEASFRTAELRRLTHTTAGQDGRLTAWTIYWVDGTLTSSDYIAKVYSAIYQLMGRGDESAVIVLYSTNDDRRDADRLIQTFLAENYAAIDASLRQARAGK